MAAHNTATHFRFCFFATGGGIFMWKKPYMLALLGRPSLHGHDACMVYSVKGASRRNSRQRDCETSFSPDRVFLLSRNSRVRFWGLILWHLWIRRAKHPLARPSLSPYY